MNTGLGLQGAMAVAQAGPVQPPHSQATIAAAKKAAQQFESVFVSEFLGSMFEGISTDGPFGGGQGEEMFRSLMLDQYGKEIVARGGFGLSASITKQLLAHQEKAQ
ncbi:MAG TPA: rod-binding protein [Rhizomicrobium sp.]|jgi:flagellar protein FlgJ|nr:rod-binding protein [Rhizomicrobium sp.]